MATYTETTAVHETLTETVVDLVTLSDQASGTSENPKVTVVNRTGTSEIYFTFGTTAKAPADPAVGGANTYVVPAAVSSVTVSLVPGTHPVMVKLISAGAMAYSVETL